MAVTQPSSGTQTATVGTEHTLATITVAGIYVLHVDAAALAAGEELELRVYKTILAAGTERLLDVYYFKHAQGEPCLAAIPVICFTGIRATLKQVGGTGRAYPWALERTDG